MRARRRRSAFAVSLGCRGAGAPLPRAPPDLRTRGEHGDKGRPTYRRAPQSALGHGGTMKMAAISRSPPRR